MDCCWSWSSSFGYLMQRADSLEKTGAGKDWRQKEKGVAEQKVVRQHHWLSGNESEQTPRDSEGQGSLACCSPRGETQLSNQTITTTAYHLTFWDVFSSITMIVLFTYFLDCYRENKLLSLRIRKVLSLTAVRLQGFPDISVGKESACNAGDPSSIPGLGRSAREGKGYPLQYSGLENSMDCTVHGVAKSWTWPSDFHFQCFSSSHHFVIT